MAVQWPLAARVASPWTKSMPEADLGGRSRQHIFGCGGQLDGNTVTGLETGEQVQYVAFYDYTWVCGTGRGMRVEEARDMLQTVVVW